MTSLRSAAPLAPHDHRVEFYDADDALVGSVVDFLHPALASGVAIIVGTPEHREAISAALQSETSGAPSAGGRVVMLDAEAALERFMSNGRADPGAFGDVVAEALRDAAHIPAATSQSEADAVARWQFPAEVTSGGHARRRLRNLMDEWSVFDVRSQVELLTTELVTNAVLHADSPVVVNVRRRGTTLRVEVTDVGTGAPRRRERDLAATHGRGLLLVEEMSSSWGVVTNGEAKTVWFELHTRSQRER